MCKKVLVCDDDAGILDLVVMILEDAGFNAISEINSFNVSSVVEKEQPDLVLLDLWMPVMSGDQVLAVLKSNPKTNHLPVIVISASIEGKQISAMAGANDFLAKPFDIDQLLTKVKQQLN